MENVVCDELRLFLHPEEPVGLIWRHRDIGRGERCGKNLRARARGLIKHLVADGRYDSAETGSLLSIRQSVDGIVIPSEEVSMRLDPLDFEEFCWATRASRTSATRRIPA